MTETINKTWIVSFINSRKPIDWELNMVDLIKPKLRENWKADLKKNKLWLSKARLEFSALIYSS